MRRAEITEHLDEIIEFAGVSKFIDTQVKRYSSGMNARLGFAIAAHLDPDVLIIDEVLSVGDMAFQRKCIERMEWFKSQGVAIVFVSHNLQAVASLCDRALYLHSSTQALGEPDEVLAKYIAASGAEKQARADAQIQIVSAHLLCEGRPVSTTTPGSKLTLRVTFNPRIDAFDATLGFLVYRSTDQLVVYGGHFAIDELRNCAFRAGQPITLDFDFYAHLTRGHYHMEVSVYEGKTLNFLGQLLPAANFSVQESSTWTGVADLGVAISRGPLAASPGTPADMEPVSSAAGSER
jgi:lipopolysaccharide transport system ATP-binding protein